MLYIRPLCRTILLLGTCWASSTISAQASPQPVSEPVLEQHLQQLEERFSEQIAPLFDAIGDSEPEARRALEVAIFSNHLVALEPHLQALEPERADALRRRLEALNERLANLAANEEPAAVDARPKPRAALRPTPMPAITSLGVKDAPGNDDCGSAMAIGNGTFDGDITMATTDGDSSCVASPPGQSPDVWFRYTAPADGPVTAYFAEESLELVISVHAVCPGTPINEIGCSSRFVRFDATAGSDVLIRVGSDFGSAGGPFTLNVAPSTRISGVVTDAASGAPLSADVDVLTSSPFDTFPIGSATTDATGAYDIVVGPPGTYFARAESVEHLGEYFDDVICDSDCSPPVGTPIELAAGEGAEGIDFELDRLGSISGQVVDAKTGAPIPSVVVRILDEFGNTVRFDTTDDSGDYRVMRLKAGDYFALAGTPDYLDELYDDIPCLDPGFGGDCDVTAGTPIPVTLNADTPGIDFALEPSGGIAGTVVHAATGEPLPLVNIVLVDVQGFFAGGGITDAFGNYSIGGLNPGVYFAKTSNFGDFVDELYDGIVCHHPVGCQETSGTPIAVEVSAVTAGIDFALDLGGKVEGTVIVAATGAPMENASVSIMTPGGETARFVDTDASGRYTADGLATGTYFAAASFFSYRVEAFDDQPCPGEAHTCDLTVATPIPLTVESTTRGIDFDIDRKGIITGTVTTLETGEPIPNSVVTIWNEAGGHQDFIQPGDSGHYEVTNLDPGTYFVTAEDYSHLDELYDGLPCTGGPPDGCDVTSGTPVVLELNASATVDFVLSRRPMGAVSGMVRGAAGEPLDNISIEIYDLSGNSAGFSSTGADGTYQVIGLSPGSYFVIASRSGFIGELFDDIPCRFGTCDPTAGTPVQVADGSTTTGIDFTLTRLGVISGTVRDSLLGRSIDGTSVRLFDASGASVDASSSGDYIFEGLDPGTYFVTTQGNEGFREELYDNFPCPLSMCDPTVGTPVVAELDAPRSGVDFLLDLEQGITGKVVDALTGQPIQDVLIDIWDEFGPRNFVLTGPTGEFVVGLPIGTYFLVTDLTISSFDGTDEVYDDIPCQFGSCDPTAGTPVPVVGGAITQNIDFALTPDSEDCSNTSTAVCLADDRFRVEVAWEDHEGNQGSGQATELTEATGTFWFFGADNIELVVKVLDACVDPFNRFWVFAAGLTDVGVEITITDTLSGEVKTYSNPLGTPFAPVQDTAAFSTCLGDRAESTSPPSVEVLTRELQQQFERPLDAEVHATSTRVVAKTGSCVPNATSLCLSNNRFRVESEWRTVDGATGQGQAVQLSDATGFFWFFSNDNIEALVKILDACVDPFNHFWVFAAGLTDVEVTLKVTDTESGEVKIYENPLGTPFRPIQDTRAFDTCSEGLN